MNTFQFVCVMLLISVKVMSLACPSVSELQSDYVKSSFDVMKIQGFWNEIAYKDDTQPRFCSCISSNKTIVLEENRIKDAFSIQCVGKPYSSDLSFNLTDQRGILLGTWRGAPFGLDKVSFPDTVVDVGLSYDQNGNVSYEWLIEFQCIPKGKKDNWFYAFNFYSRTSDSSLVYENMLKSAEMHGLKPFIDEGLPIHMVSQKNCVRPQ